MKIHKSIKYIKYIKRIKKYKNIKIRFYASFFLFSYFLLTTHKSPFIAGINRKGIFVCIYLFFINQIQPVSNFSFYSSFPPFFSSQLGKLLREKRKRYENEEKIVINYWKQRLTNVFIL